MVTYGSKTWKDKNSLVIFERKVCRKMFGLCKDVNTGERRIRKNRELEGLY
jgi:hypothetical protein